MEKIAINFLPLLHGGGTATYAHLLLEKFSVLPVEELENFFFIFPEGVPLPPVFLSSPYSVVLPVKSRRRKIIAEQLVIPSLLKSRGIHWLHQLAFSIPYRHKHLKLITTIHDLTFQLYPQTLPVYKRIYYAHNFTRSICRSHCLITDSGAIKEQILQQYSLEPDKVDVIPLGVSSRWAELPSQANQSEILKANNLGSKEYFLHVGTLEPRKNISQLLLWWSRWKKETDHPARLILAGNKGWGASDLLSRIKKAPDVYYAGNVDFQSLQALYLNAVALLSLSHYEGFGLPLAEAAYYNIPLVVSNIPVYREIRNTDRYMATDYYAFAELLHACYEKEKTYQELVKISRHIKQKYDFDTSFKKLLNRYRTCILKK